MIRWLHRLIWWNHPDVERDQQARDAAVKEVDRRAQVQIARATELGEEIARMKRLRVQKDLMARRPPEMEG